MNLKRRGMDMVCGRINEDGAHLFFKCKTIERVWNILGMEAERLLLAEKNSARDVIEAILALREEPRLKCSFILWFCWTERNRIRDGEQGRSPSSLAHGIQVYMAAWNNRGSTEKPTRSASTRAWERPPLDHVKVDCDAAFDPQSGSGGWGCILRHSDGDVVTARRSKLAALLEPLQGEIIACIQGVQTAIDAGVTQVIVETDALAVVQAVYSNTYDLSAMANIVAELRSLLSLNFNSWRVSSIGPGNAIG
jgi:hypothetical protein